MTRKRVSVDKYKHVHIHAATKIKHQMAYILFQWAINKVHGFFVSLGFSYKNETKSWNNQMIFMCKM